MARRIIRILERIVSLPGTVADIKEWGRILAPAVPTGILLWEAARDRVTEIVVSRGEAIATVDMGLSVIGWCAVVVTVLVILAVIWNTHREHSVTWMEANEAHVLLRNNWIAGQPPDMHSPWDESIGKDRMHSFYKVQSYLDDFEREHPKAVRKGEYNRQTLSVWIGRKLRDREASGTTNDPDTVSDKAESPNVSSQRLSSTVENRTRVLVRVYAERENEEIRLSVQKRPHPQNLEWTEGGKEFRTIAKGMLGVAHLCDVRFSGGDHPTFDLRYRTPGSDWISHYLQVDESGTVYRGIALVRVIVESLTFGTTIHELTFDATWFVDIHEMGAPVESTLTLYENGSQNRRLWSQAYTKGFWLFSSLGFD